MNYNKINFAKFSVFILGIIAISSIFMPQKASAQVIYVCPEGYYMTQFFGLQECKPLDGRDDDIRGGNKMPKPKFKEIDSFAAVAWHEETSEVWGTIRQPSEKKAIDTVLSACNSAMGGGCKFGYSAWNSAISYYTDSLGTPWFGWGENLVNAQNAAREKCNKFGTRCKSGRTYVSLPISVSTNAFASKPKPENYFPNGAIKRHDYALVAWVKNKANTPFNDKYWILSGVQNFDVALKKIKNNCERESKQECQVSLSVLNGYLAAYGGTNKKTYWSYVYLHENIDQIMREECMKNSNSNCKLFAKFDSKTKREMMIEVKNPYYYSN